MKPTLVLVGRPNVGKSTLFNRLTRSKDALVADFPGLTRDRRYGHGRLGDKPYLIVDTGGFEPAGDSGILHEMTKQTMRAADEADAVIFLLDGRTGLTPQDKQIAERLRRGRAPVYVAVNKCEGMDRASSTADFYELGLGEPYAVSSAHGDGVRKLIDDILRPFPDEPPEPELSHPRFAVIGRPNVGKSTLVNALLGEERVIVFDRAGTTRDSVYIDFERGGQKFTVIDTAGVRRRGKIEEAIEKYSVIKTIRAVEDANVTVLVLDASQDIADQDANVAGFALEAGRALVIAVNKWDAVDAERRAALKRDIDRKLYFLDFARLHYISALNGRGVADLFASVRAAHDAALIKMPTPKITAVLRMAVERQAPPRTGTTRPKMRYAHQGGSNPPVIVIHGNALQHVPAAYTRYLGKIFRQAFALQGTPLRIQYRESDNPYVGEDGPRKNMPRRAALSKRIAKKEERKAQRQNPGRKGSKKS